MRALRIGFIPLCDCAILAVAQERGIFHRHGLAVELSREVSWANIRDKVAIGALDGAQMLAGMPLAGAVGIDPMPGPPLITAFSLGLNGNVIALSTELWKQMAAADPEGMRARPITAAPLRPVLRARRAAGRPPLRLATVYPFASHNYELRYWLAAAGIDPDRDVQLTVVPPPRVVDALARGAIDGCCVGEPWGSLAVAHGVARIAITAYEIWNNSPEKVLAMRGTFAEHEPAVHQALLTALLEAAAWADAPEHRSAVARILANDRYIGAPAAILAHSLSGDLPLGNGVPPAPLPDFLVLHRYAANFPWTSHAMWLLLQMLRWGQLARPIDLLATAAAVYRPDLFRQAARAVGIPAPSVDLKSEGTHSERWWLTAASEPIAMGSDRFIDGREFHPQRPVEYLAQSPFPASSLSLDALATLNG